MVSDAITRHLKDYTVSLKTGSTIINGKVTPTYSTQTKRLAIFPLTGKDLKYLPEGFYNSQDIKIYEIGSPTMASQYRLSYKGQNYEIFSVSDRSIDGGFTSYLAKRL